MKILLICGNGVSSGMIAQKIRKAGMMLFLMHTVILSCQRLSMNLMWYSLHRK